MNICYELRASMINASNDRQKALGDYAIHHWDWILSLVRQFGTPNIAVGSWASAQGPSNLADGKSCSLIHQYSVSQRA
jgi:hypothetical protein